MKKIFFTVLFLSAIGLAVHPNEDSKSARVAIKIRKMFCGSALLKDVDPMTGAKTAAFSDLLKTNFLKFKSIRERYEKAIEVLRRDFFRSEMNFEQLYRGFAQKRQVMFDQLEELRFALNNQKDRYYHTLDNEGRAPSSLYGQLKVISHASAAIRNILPSEENGYATVRDARWEMLRNKLFEKTWNEVDAEYYPWIVSSLISELSEVYTVEYSLSHPLNITTRVSLKGLLGFPEFHALKPMNKKLRGRLEALVGKEDRSDLITFDHVRWRDEKKDTLVFAETKLFVGEPPISIKDVRLERLLDTVRLRMQVVQLFLRPGLNFEMEVFCPHGFYPDVVELLASEGIKAVGPVLANRL